MDFVDALMGIADVGNPAGDVVQLMRTETPKVNRDRHPACQAQPCQPQTEMPTIKMTDRWRLVLVAVVIEFCLYFTLVSCCMFAF